MQTRHSLACIAAIVSQLFLVGCGSGRDDGLWAWPQAPIRAAFWRNDGAQTEVAADSLNRNDSASAASAKPDADPNANRPAAPRAILEAAGAIIEVNAEGQPAGVNLSGAEISTELMQTVAELGEIQWLDLRGARVRDEHLSVLGQLPHLQLLALSDTQVTDEGLRHVQGLQELRFLSLDRTAVSDVGLEHLAGMPQLEGVSLQGTRVSQAGARSFEEQTPNGSAILDDDAPAESPVSTPDKSREPSPGEPSFEEPSFGEPSPRQPSFGEPSFGEPTSSTHSGSSRSPRQESARKSSMPQRPVTDVRQTRQQLTSLLEQKLLDPEILGALGQHLLAQRNYHQAARAFEAVLRHQPDDLGAHFGLGVALARLGEFESARPHFVEVVGEATAFYNLGVIAYELQQPDVSERYFQKALSRAAEFEEARHWIAYIRREKDVTPASHTPRPADDEGLVNLLISEFGRVSGNPQAVQSGSSGIQIVPAEKSASPDRQQINW